MQQVQLSQIVKENFDYIGGDVYVIDILEDIYDNKPDLFCKCCQTKG